MLPMPVTPPPAIEVMYVGGPTAVIEIDGYRIITDPTFDEAGTKYPGPVVLVKTMSPAVKANEVGKVDLVLLSHDEHADNLDHRGRELMEQVGNTMTTVSGASRIKKNVVGLKPWEFRRVKTPNGRTLRITATPARHGPNGIEKVVGDVVGFVVTLEETHQDLVYVMGDTVWYDGIKEVSRRFKPKAVLLFGGAVVTPLTPSRLTMDVNEAVEVAHAFPRSAIIPVHHEGWAHFKQSKEDIKQTYGLLGLGSRILELKPGRALAFPKK